MNYYERHIGDYLKDTSHLSLLEHGVYTRLLDVYYTREGGIPAGDAARLVGARTKEERAALALVLSEFFEPHDGAHRQGRADREIERFRDKQAKAKRSAEARWSAQKTHSESNANASPNAMLTHSERNANGMHRAPVPSNQTPDPIHSEPIGSAAIAAAPPVDKSSPPTDRDMVFASGVPLLTAAGVTERNARSFLAAQCKAHGEPAVRAAISRCASERPIEPVPWLVASLGDAPKQRKADALMAGNISAAQRFLSHGERS